VVAIVTALAVLLGVGVGLGLLSILVGVRGSETRPTAAPRLSPRPLEGHTLRLAGAVGAGVLVGAATGWPLAALIAGAGCWAIPKLFGDSKDQAGLIARVEAIAGWAEMLRDTMAGAAGLEQAIAASAPVAPLPIRPQVVELAGRLERGRLGPSLRAFAEELADPTADLVVAALLLAGEHQAGRLGDLLGGLAASARDQATMRLRVEAGRARTRTSVRVIVGVTAGLALFLAVLNHGYLAPYSTPTGQLVLLVVGALFAAGFAWLAKMTRPSRPARLLRADPVLVGEGGR
jgi:tight adherence protein B